MLNNTEHFELFKYLEDLFDDKLNMIFTSQPATIESFNADENTVNIKLDKEGYKLDDIPISLFGNPSSYITTPTLEKGTKGLLIFSKHDLYSWVEDGTDEHAKTDFSKNNAFFLIGVTNQKNLITYNTEAIEIKTDKSVEIISENDTSITSNKNINFTSTLSTNINCKDFNVTASNNIALTGINLNFTGSAGVNVSAPKISFSCSTTGEELINLVKGISDEVKGLSTALSLSKDSNGVLLSNSSEIATYINKFDVLSSKLGGF